MNVKTFFLIIVSVISFQIDAYEYFYPVAGIQKNNERYLYLLYQKDNDHLELFLWHEKTKILSKVLPSHCMPAGLRLIPDQKGFSFIDNGRIKIKLFNKRSPKVIDFHESIYQIEMIEWIDAQNFYFCAKENGRYGIFQSNRDGLLQAICIGDSVDCIYPQKIENSLFYVEKTHESTPRYSIKCTAYPVRLMQNLDFNAVDDFDARVEQLLQSKDKESFSKNNAHSVQDELFVCDNSEQQISFLRMTSTTQGYFIQHAPTVDNNNCITFEYYQLKKSKKGWNTSYLFSFKIPLFFLSDEIGNGYTYRSENPYRMYESMLPFLPCHTVAEIYYSSASQDASNHVFLYSYNILTGHITQNSNSVAFLSNTFGVINLDGTIFYGGSLNQACDDNRRGRFLYKAYQDSGLPLGMYIDNDGHTCYDQPFILK